MDFYFDFATDEESETNGVWRELDADTKVLVARANNPEYTKAMAAAFMEHREVLDGVDSKDPAKVKAAEAKSDEIMADIMARTILKGWSGVTFKRKPMEYSVANARQALAQRELRVRISRLSSDLSQYLVKEEKEQGEA